MLKILTLPNPKLRQKTREIKKVDKKISRVINDLTALLTRSEKPKGIGLAAPQTGLDLKIILIRIDKSIIPFINPEIITSDGEIIEGFEGCLSVPGIYGYVKRPAIITLSALTNYVFDKNGTPSLTTNYQLLTSAFDSLPARIIQHETDHLNGLLFVDRILQQKGKFYKLKGKDKEGKEVFEEINLTF